MLYIISGASRAGKTMIAKKLAARKGISYLSLDWLMMGFTNGIPEYGIHDKLFPDEIAERAWSFFKAMMESMLYVEENCIIEGEAVLPALIVELMEKYPDQIKTCFVGFTSVDVEDKFRDIKLHSTATKDWLIDESDEYIKDHIQNMITHSIQMEQACRQHGITYFDTSEDFLGTIEEVIHYLSK